MSQYDPSRIEPRWQKIWEKERIYQPDLRQAKRPFYNLMMFPYPSAEGLHVGNMYAFTGADIYGRFKRMQGFNVFEPIGLDGFGIHSENYALRIGEHPAKVARKTQKNFYRQLRATGNAYDWTKTLETYDSAYYKWTQWLFIQMFKHGLAYRKKSAVNWCPSCQTVLADEQVEGGVCERCKSATTRKETKQWFFKITDYADRLLANLNRIDWPEKIKTAQRNWIGRSEGTEIIWKIEGAEKSIRTFTTRLDTVYGATFLVTAPDHPVLQEFKLSRQADIYRTNVLKKTEQKRKASEGEKSGVDTGLCALHPLTNKKVPIWIADFVLMTYGTGAVMGVPAHDKRDFEFAKKFGLPIKAVVSGAGQSNSVFAEDGVLVHSGKYNGLTSGQARKKMLADGEEAGWAKARTAYHLRDWLISRQRYWGPPIPMVYCGNCDWQPVPEDQLPVLLPDLKDYQPAGDGKSPLEKAPESWLFTRCPQCGQRAQRETDVSDTFLDSSWYFLAYPNLSTPAWKSGKKPFDQEITQKWLPVDAYIGGAEHAVLHLLYSRFVTMFLHDQGYVGFEEPFPFLFSHGLLVSQGAKMSKSRGNVVNPDEYIQKYGADTLRVYLMFLGPFEQGGDFQDQGIRGAVRFLNKFWRLVEKSKSEQESDEKTLKKLHKTIKKVGGDIEELKYNTAIAALMELASEWEVGRLSREEAIKAIKLLAPFAPHLAEELWQALRSGKWEAGDEMDKNDKLRYQDGSKFESVHLQPWPEHDPDLVKEKSATIVIQVDGKKRGVVKIQNAKSKIQKEVEKEARRLDRAGKYLEGVKIESVIFVPGKLINFVLGQRPKTKDQK